MFACSTGDGQPGPQTGGPPPRLLLGFQRRVAGASKCAMLRSVVASGAHVRSGSEHPLASPQLDGATSYLGQLARARLLTREGEIEIGKRNETSEHDVLTALTQQFRAGEAMVYDLRGGAGRLSLRVTGRGGGDGPPTEWDIEASPSSAPDAVVVSDGGATRPEALRAGRSWNEKRLANNLPSFNWESVARAMAAVRSIGGAGA